MAGWCVWTALAACAVITQGLARADEYQIPAIPFGRRAQYYVLHDDGDFKYGYDTGVGAYESAVKMGSGDLTGFFGFNNALGENVRVDYTAGAGGFQPRGDHLPVAPQASDVQSASVYSSQTHGTTASRYSAGTGSAAAATGYSASSNQGRTRPVEEANIRSENNIDGSYSFSYDNSDSSRRESGDADNNVVGQFSFVADDGQNRQIRYRAGSATGFVAEGDGIPEAPAVPAVPSFQSAAAPAAAVPDVASVRQGYSYTAPQQPAVSTLYSAPDNFLSAAPGDGPRRDASYSFSYQNDQSARDESADPDLNVKGSFSFVGDDGQSRRVDYIAGSGTGFVATGDHLPVAPEPSDPASSATPVQYSAPARSPPPAATRSQTLNAQANRDASYQFNYETGDSSRSESADADLNVRGDFSFVADDGQRRTVSYVAGSGTGFVAEGSHLPVAPEVPVVPAVAQPTAYQAPVVPQQSRGVVGAGTYSAPVDAPRRDASYSFSYETADSSRAEAADSDLNVQGEYSFTGDDGQVRTVKYTAGSGTGFVAEGDHLPSGVPISPDFTSASVYSGSPSAGTPQAPQQASYGSHSSFFKSSQNNQVGANIASTRNVDGSYSFSYQNPDSSRTESADSDNNVVGEYSFVADDGENRRIRYRAGSATGFVADGSSVPTSPEFKSAAYSPSTLSGSQTSTGSKVGTTSTAVEYSAPSSIASQRDASYSFNYNTGDSSRTEESDRDLNVRGSYSFVADDGVNRQVNYVAGSSTGFVAEGDHLPKSPEAAVVGTGTRGSQTFLKSAPAISSIASGGASVATYSASNQEAANVRSSLGADGGYSFSYTNSDSSRSESGDADNNVVGQFSFVADDGQNRQVRYRAGAATGFVAEGDGIPEVPEVAGTASLRQADAPKVQGYAYSAPVSTGSVAAGSATVRAGSNFAQTNEARGDASYSFKYDAGDSDREESADSDLNVRGQYSFVADDGVRRNVNYRAGSSTGFVAEGDHLPVAPEVSSVAQVPSTRTATGSASSIASTGSIGSTSSIGSTGSVRSSIGTGFRSSTGSGSIDQIVGNVRLRQYISPSPKVGYVFIEV